MDGNCLQHLFIFLMQNKSCSQASIIILSECIGRLSYIITKRPGIKILITWNKVLWQRSQQKPVVDRGWSFQLTDVDWSLPLSLCFRFSFIILCVWVFWPHVPLCTTCVCLVSKEVVSLYLGPKNQTWLPWNKTVPLTTKPTLQPCLGQTSISGKCSCLSHSIGQILSQDLTVNPTASEINSHASRLLSTCCLQPCHIPGWWLHTTFSAVV